MNIAYVNADAGIPLFATKGASVHVRDFADAASQIGHAVHVFTAKAGPASASWRLPFSVLLSTDPTPLETPEQQYLRANTRTRRILTDAHTRQRFDMVYERYSLWSHAALSFARRHHLPFVLEVNSPLIVEQARYRALDRHRTARRIERYLFAGASRIVAVSAEVAAYVCDQGADPSRVVVVPNGVDLSLYDAVEPPRATDDTFTIGFLGSLKPWHGLDVLIDALTSLASRAPRYHLRIVGDGPERAHVERVLDSRGLAARATIVGQVARERVPAELSHVDCTVAPYPRLDGFYFSPLKVFEYMAAGRPIVASRIGQIESVLEHERTAVLVEPGSPPALADAIEALATEPERAQRLAHAARQRAFARHGWTHAVRTALDGLDRMTA